MGVDEVEHSKVGEMNLLPSHKGFCGISKAVVLVVGSFLQ